MNTVSRLRLRSDLAASAASRRDRQQLSDLISLVYDAAIDQSLWENAIESVAYFVRRSGAFLEGHVCATYQRTSPLRNCLAIAGRIISTNISGRSGTLSRRDRTADRHCRPDALR